jgi:hypothetical protein
MPRMSKADAPVSLDEPEIEGRGGAAVVRSGTRGR